MAISLGDVNFRLGVDARALGRGVAQLRRFGSTVDKAASSSEKGAARTARALLDQEKAAISALRTVRNLNTQLRKIGGSASSIRAANKSWRSFNKTLTSGQLSARGFSRASDQFNNSIANIRRGTKKASTSGNKFADTLRNMASTSILIEGPLGGVAARLQLLASVANRANLKLAALFASISLGLFGIIKIGKAAVLAGRDFQAYERTLKGVAGSQALANSLLKEAKKIANDTGQAFAAVIPSFTRFTAATKGTALQGKKGTEVFRDFSFIAGQLQLPVDQTTRTFKALEQMISKGTVQSEELRGQLGDQLPGAFQAASRAMGVSTIKLGEMLKKGEVISTDFLPKLAKEMIKTLGLQGTKRIVGFTASLNRMTNAFTDLFLRVNEISFITERVGGFFDNVAKAVNFVTANLENFTKGLVVAISLMSGFIASKTLNGLILLATGFKNLAKSVLFLNAASLMPGIVGLIGIITALTVGTFLFHDELNSIMPAIDRVRALFVGLGIALAGLALIKIAVGVGTLSTALLILRGVLIRTGFGIIVVLIGEAVFQFSRLSKAVGGSGRAFRLLVAVAKEAWDRIILGGQVLINGVTVIFAEIAIIWSKMVRGLGKIWRDFVVGIAFNLKDSPIKAVRDAAMSLHGAAVMTGVKVNEMTISIEDSVIALEALKAKGKELQDQSKKPFKSIQKIIEILNIDGSDPFENRSGISIPKFNTDPIEIPGGGGGSSKGNKSIKALQKYNRLLLETKDNIVALSAAPRLVDKLERAFKIDKTLRKVSDDLIKAGFSVEFVQGKIGVLREFLKREDTLEDWAERVRGGFDVMKDATGSGIDSFVTNLADSIFKGESVLKGLADTAKSVAQDIIKTLMKLTITNPLMNMLFPSTNAPTLGGGGGGLISSLGKGLAGLLGAPTVSRNGNVFNSGGITKLAKGGILTRPTIMDSASGPAIGGEAGQEAIMPLSRDSSGRLGVRASGGTGAAGNITGGDVFINITAPEGTKTTQRKRSDNSGNQFIDIIISTVNEAAVTGKLDAGVGTAFGLKRNTIRR